MKRKLKENANSFLGTRLTIFTVFIVQLIIMYYPFYVIFKNIFSHDMIGLSGYLFYFMLDLVFISYFLSKWKIKDRKEINRIKKLDYQSSKEYVSYDQFIELEKISDSIVKYLEHRSPKNFYNYLVEKYKVISILSYDKLLSELIMFE